MSGISVEFDDGGGSVSVHKDLGDTVIMSRAAAEAIAIQILEHIHGSRAAASAAIVQRPMIEAGW